MGQRVIFKVFGHGELNGNYKIDIEKEMDAELAYKLRSKNNLIQFVKQECPGVKIKENTLDYRITPIKQTTASKSTSKQNSENTSNTKTKTKSSDKGLTSIVGGVIGGAIVNAINAVNETDSTYNAELEKRKIEVESYREQKEIEQEQKIKETKERIKQEKIEKAKLDLANGGNRISYIIKRFWISLDKTWKKILFFYLLFMVLIFASDFFTQWSDKKELETINNRFVEIVNQAEIEISKNNINSLEISLTELNKIIEETNIDNEFVRNYESRMKKEWTFKLNKLKAKIKRK